MLKISVIIPVYNVEKYLDKCLESLINQSFTDMEFICINDGSTDNSLEILNRYAKKDNRFIIIDKKNEGVSKARNIGLENATGDYIMFLDSDDAYAPDLCEKVVEKIKTENPDIVVWGHKDVKEGQPPVDVVKNINRVLNHKTAKKTKHWIALQVYIWDKAFRRELLTRNNIKFPIGLKNAEDMIFCTMTYFTKPKYALIPEGLYLYTIERDGASTNANSECIANDLKAFKYLSETNEFQSQPRKIQILLANHFMGGSNWYYKKAHADKKLRQKYLEDIKVFLAHIKKQYSFFDRMQIKNYKKMKMLILKTNIRGIK